MLYPPSQIGFTLKPRNPSQKTSIIRTTVSVIVGVLALVFIIMRLSTLSSNESAYQDQVARSLEEMTSSDNIDLAVQDITLESSEVLEHLADSQFGIKTGDIRIEVSFNSSKHPISSTDLAKYFTLLPKNSGVALKEASICGTHDDGQTRSVQFCAELSKYRHALQASFKGEQVSNFTFEFEPCKNSSELNLSLEGSPAADEDVCATPSQIQALIFDPESRLRIKARKQTINEAKIKAAFAKQAEYLATPTDAEEAASAADSLAAFMSDLEAADLVETKHSTIYDWPLLSLHMVEVYPSDFKTVQLSFSPLPLWQGTGQALTSEEAAAAPLHTKSFSLFSFSAVNATEAVHLEGLTNIRMSNSTGGRRRLQGGMMGALSSGLFDEISGIVQPNSTDPNDLNVDSLESFEAPPENETSTEESNEDASVPSNITTPPSTNNSTSPNSTIIDHNSTTEPEVKPSPDNSTETVVDPPVDPSANATTNETTPASTNSSSTSNDSTSSNASSSTTNSSTPEPSNNSSMNTSTPAEESVANQTSEVNNSSNPSNSSNSANSSNSVNSSNSSTISNSSTSSNNSSTSESSPNSTDVAANSSSSSNSSTLVNATNASNTTISQDNSSVGNGTMNNSSENQPSLPPLDITNITTVGPVMNSEGFEDFFTEELFGVIMNQTGLNLTELMTGNVTDLNVTALEEMFAGLNMTNGTEEILADGGNSSEMTNSSSGEEDGSPVVPEIPPPSENITVPDEEIPPTTTTPENASNSSNNITTPDTPATAVPESTNSTASSVKPVPVEMTKELLLELFPDLINSIVQDRIAEERFKWEMQNLLSSGSSSTTSNSTNSTISTSEDQGPPMTEGLSARIKISKVQAQKVIYSVPDELMVESVVLRQWAPLLGAGGMSTFIEIVAIGFGLFTIGWVVVALLEAWLGSSSADSVLEDMVALSYRSNPKLEAKNLLKPVSPAGPPSKTGDLLKELRMPWPEKLAVTAPFCLCYRLTKDKRYKFLKNKQELIGQAKARIEAESLEAFEVLKTVRYAKHLRDQRKEEDALLRTPEYGRDISRDELHNQNYLLKQFALDANFKNGGGATHGGPAPATSPGLPGKDAMDSMSNQSINLSSYLHQGEDLQSTVEREKTRNLTIKKESTAPVLKDLAVHSKTPSQVDASKKPPTGKSLIPPPTAKVGGGSQSGAPRSGSPASLKQVSARTAAPDDGKQKLLKKDFEKSSSKGNTKK